MHTKLAFRKYYHNRYNTYLYEPFYIKNKIIDVNGERECWNYHYYKAIPWCYVEVERNNVLLTIETYLQEQILVQDNITLCHYVINWEDVVKAFKIQVGKSINEVRHILTLGKTSGLL